jgi:hypothetical protein
MLKDVACYRCPDQSVRYVKDDAAEALRKPPPTASERAAAGEDDDDDDDDDLDEEERTPREASALSLYNESLKQSAEFARRTTELMKVYESGFKAMVEPMKLACTMLTDTVKDLRTENGKHVDRWDKVILLAENLSSSQHERDVERKKEETRTEFRKGLGAAVISQLPSVIEKLQSKPAASSSPASPPPDDGAAGLALDALQSLETEFFDVFTSNLEPDQQEKFARVKTALVGRKPPGEPPQGQADDQSLNHAAPPS